MNIFTYQTLNIYLVDLRFMNQSTQNQDLRRSKRNLQSNSALAVSSPTQSGGLNDEETVEVYEAQSEVKVSTLMCKLEYINN